MSREVDRRDFSVNRVSSAREQELRRLAADISLRGLPGGQRVRVTGFDATTGNPSAVTSEAASAGEGNYIQRALDHMRTISPVLGFAQEQPVDFAPDPQVQRASSGARAVYLQQLYKGIPVFQAAQTVRFAPDGALKDSVGSNVTIQAELEVSPRITVRQAVSLAAAQVAAPDADEQDATDQFGEPLRPASVDLAGFQPQITAAFPDKPDQPTVLEAGPFGDRIKASLTWFELAEGDIRLAWEVLMTMPEQQGQYRTVVDAEDGAVLYCRQLMQSAVARGNIYQVDGSAQRQMTLFPRPLQDYGLPIPADLPEQFPDHWIESDEAVGNAVRGHLGDQGPTIRGTASDGLLTFDPTAADGDDQKVLNIFYFNCFMHDYFYLLGFREADGNFQHDNLGRGGVPSDRVDARAHSGAVFGTANMSTPVDGSSPVMNMGLVSSTGRHTAFDSSVVFHEFMHGVTNRLVGGPMNTRALDASQSRGMGEGWGDYVACTINQSTAVGSWVIKQPGGIRGFPYDEDFPDNFGDLGTGRYREEHNIGEVWCATLMEMNRNLGQELGVQLVVDALKLSPANPSFLDMRDAILTALADKHAAEELGGEDHAAAERVIWAAFAKFGMGPAARSNGATLAGIVADFNPPGNEPAPGPPEPPSEQGGFLAWLARVLRSIFGG